MQLPALGFMLSTGFIATAAAQDAPGSADRRRSPPHPEEKIPNRVFFCDKDLHTSYSTDAGMIGNTLAPEEAYRFARGQTVTSRPAC